MDNERTHQGQGRSSVDRNPGAHSTESNRQKVLGTSRDLEPNGIGEDITIPIVGYETMEERAKFTVRDPRVFLHPWIVMKFNTVFFQVFKLKIENEKVGDTWLVFRRYTDFMRLHAKVCK